MIGVLNWLSLTATVLAVGYWLGGIGGVITAAVIYELVKLGLSIFSEFRLPKH